MTHPLLECPATIMMDRMASRWTIPVMALVSEKPIRFNQLRRELGGISQKMLSQTLKSLERDGIISRKATATVPLTVEYALTALGRTLVDAFGTLRTWSEVNYRDVVDAQARFDQQAAASAWQ